jgi:hypothetical protein
MSNGDATADKRFSERWLWRRGLLAWLFALVLQAVASLMPRVVETAYSNGFYFFLVRLLSILNGITSSAIGEILILILVIVTVSYVIWLLWNRHFKWALLFLFWLLGVGFASFLVLWGLNYQREPLAYTMGMLPRAVSPWELSSIGQTLVGEVNNLYGAAYDLADSSTPGVMPISITDLYQVLEQSFQSEPLLGAASQGGLSPPKPLRFSNLMTRMGISGYYIPYTGEATYNQQVPSAELPFVLAHEKAHQRGYAREDEADFVAFLVCVESPDPYVQYSGYLYAMRELARADSAGFNELFTALEQGPGSDLRTSREFWANGPHPALSLLVSYVNDAHLRANRVSSGIGNYGEDVPLIVSYLCKRFNLCNPQ